MTDEPDNCENGDVMLRGGTSKSNGLVVMCEQSQWQPLCDDVFEIEKARNICKQLHFDPEGTQLFLSMNLKRICSSRCHNNK